MLHTEHLVICKALYVSLTVNNIQTFKLGLIKQKYTGRRVFHRFIIHLFPLDSQLVV